jgi:hypothetical protein
MCDQKEKVEDSAPVQVIWRVSHSVVLPGVKLKATVKDKVANINNKQLRNLITQILMQKQRNVGLRNENEGKRVYSQQSYGANDGNVCVAEFGLATIGSGGRSDAEQIQTSVD